MTGPWPHCVRWGPSSPSPKGAQPSQFSAHACCGKMAGWIKMPLGREEGLGPGHIVSDGDPAPPPQRGTAPNSRPMSIVTKRSPISATAEHSFTYENHVGPWHLIADIFKMLKPICTIGKLQRVFCWTCLLTVNTKWSNLVKVSYSFWKQKTAFFGLIASWIH